MLKKITYSLLITFIIWGYSFTFAKAAIHVLGSNVVTADGTVYTITTENGQTVRRPYTSAGAYLSYGFNSWNNLVNASPDDNILPIGSFIPPQDGKVICSDRGADKGTCYLISQGAKIGFPSEQIFKAQGFNFSKALYGDTSFLNHSSNIQSGNEAHKAGVLINLNGTVYLVGPNGLLGFPDVTIFDSWTYSFSNVITANAADSLLPIAGVIQSKNRGQLSAFTPFASQNSDWKIYKNSQYGFQITLSDAFKDYSVTKKVHDYYASDYFTFIIPSTGLSPQVNVEALTILTIPLNTWNSITKDPESTPSGTVLGKNTNFVFLAQLPQDGAGLPASLLQRGNGSEMWTIMGSFKFTGASTGNISISNINLPNGIVGQPYSGSIAWAAPNVSASADVFMNVYDSSALPFIPGLTLSPNGLSGAPGAPIVITGLKNTNGQGQLSIGGTPTQAGTYTFTITFRESQNNTSDTRTVTLTIAPASNLTFSLSGGNTTSVSANNANQTIGTFVLTNNSADTLNFSGLTIQMANSNITGNFQNLKLFVAGVQVGASQSTASPSNGSTFTFNTQGPAGGIPVNINPQTSVLVTITADLPFVVHYFNSQSLLTVSGVTGAWQSNGQVIAQIPSLAGQTVTVQGASY